MATVLVHGAWSTGEVWQGVVANLDGEVLNPTLPGCGADRDAARGLDDAVDALLDLVADLRDVTLVGHSWSGIPTWMAAARSTSVRHLLLVQAFEPKPGAALVDAFGPAQRDDELDAIAAHDGLWPPPAFEEVRDDPGLTTTAARRLADDLVPHPGRTVTDEVTGPLELGQVQLERLDPPDGPLHAGHWPMVSAPGALAAWIQRQGHREP